MNALVIRKGEAKDLPAALTLIQELAIYENEPDAVICTVDSMMRDGFGKDKIFDFFIAELNGQCLGIAVYYFKYSTWKGRCLFLEDIVVTEEYRNKGIGSLLFEEVKNVAIKTKSRRMEWQVLDWNEPAIKFYEKHGASFDGEWLNVKFEWDFE